MWTADYLLVPAEMALLYHREGYQSQLAKAPYYKLRNQPAILSTSNSREKFQPFNNFRWIIPQECQMTGHQQAAPHYHYDPF